MNVRKAARLMIIVLGTGFILIWGKALIIPFVMSLILWFIIKEVRELLERIPFVKKRFPNWLKSTLASLIIFVTILVIVNLLGSNIQQLSQKLPTYEPNIERFAQ